MECRKENKHTCNEFMFNLFNIIDRIYVRRLTNNKLEPTYIKKNLKRGDGITVGLFFFSGTGYTDS